VTLLGPADVRAIALELGMHPRKSLGQNFVIDPNTIRRIVRLADLPPASEVMEVGPGLGSLTLGLVEAGHRVTAVEVDPVLSARLPVTVAQADGSATADRLRVVTADALQIPGSTGSPDALVANLPYNVAVPVLLHCLATFPSITRTLVMVQSEVAERLAAPPGSRTYGVPSVKARWFGEVQRMGSVPPSVFWPVPRVDSGLVLIRATAAPATDVPREQVFGLIDRLFGQRRKMVRSTLGGDLGAPAAAQVLADARIPGDLRPERLDLAGFIRLAEAMDRRAG
jgi:16S rRNA (adenine1518-N6/adenine1519-N6)-dimethyltransferase